MLHEKNPAFIKEDKVVIDEIKDALEPITYFFINRDLSLTWPKNLFDKLFILEDTLKIASFNFANQEMQNVKQELHQTIVDFTSAIIQNEDLENGMYSTRYYWFTHKGRNTIIDLDIEKKLEDTQNTLLYEMLNTYYKFLTVEKKILQENITPPSVQN